MHSLCRLLQDIETSTVIAYREQTPILASQWRADIASVAAQLRTEGQQKIALYCPDLYDFSVYLLAAWSAQIPVVLPSDCLPATLQQLAQEGIPLFGQAERITPTNTRSLDFPTLNHASVVVEVFTSGSTGQPVRISKKLAQLDHEVQALDATLGHLLPADAIITGTVGAQHLYGLLFRVLWPLASGRALATHTLQYPEHLWQRAIHLPHALISSPAFLKRLNDNHPWSALHGQYAAVFSSGGALPSDTAQQVSQFLQLPIHEIYGSSETGGVAWRNQPAQDWTPLPGVRVRSSADDLLEISSPFLPDGEWYRSADRVALSEAGFQLLGRADRLVKIEEKRISLTQIEHALSSLPEVAEVKLVVLDGKRVELGSVIVLNALGQSSLQHLGKLAFSRYLRTQLATSVERIGLPRRWRFIEQMPMNAMGKTTEKDLLALFASRPFFPACQVLSQSAEQVTLALTISADIASLEGHFAEAAVLPGVTQIDWAIHFARQHFSLPARFAGMDALKFRQMILPGHTVHLQLDWDAAKSRLAFSYHNAEQDAHYASGRLRFES